MEEETLTEILKLRLTPTEMSNIKIAAADEGRSVSNYCRFHLASVAVQPPAKTKKGKA